jgi:hypothetical protein
MIGVRVTGEDLEIAVTGYDAWLLACRPRWSLTVPVCTVRRAAARASFGPFARRHVVYRRTERLRLHLRGRLICARFAAPTLRIDLDGGPYGLIILSVSDPEAMASAINSAIPQRRGSALEARPVEGPLPRG